MADPLTSLLIVISVSGAFAMILKKIGFSTVVGYILGGLVGSLAGMPIEVSPIIAQLGLILLGFEIGAEIGGKKALGSFRQALIIELISMSLIYILTGLISIAFKLSTIEHIVLFLIALNTSTGILYKAIQGRVSEDVRSLLLSASVIEDTVAISGIALLVAAKDLTNPVDVIISIGKVGLLTIAAFITGTYLFRLLGRRLGDVEMLPILAISAALAYYIVFGLIGVSQLLGTFVAGLALARAVDLGRAISQLGGLRELGLLLYFSSLGGILSQLRGEDFLISTITAVMLIVVIIKFVAFSASLWILGLETRESIRTAIYMLSISELGIIISSQAYGSGLVGPSYFLLSIYIVMISAILSSIAIRFEESVIKGIYLLIPNRVEDLARRYLSKVRYVIALRARGLTAFLYAFIFMVFVAVIIDASITLLKYLPNPLTQYALILLVITSFIFIFSIPYLAWRSYRNRWERESESRTYIESIVGINIALLLAIFGVFLEAYLVNKIVSEYRIDIGGFQSHVLFITISIIVILYIMRRIYRTVSELYIRSQK
ncbi:MAG: cation:proton antiporter [Desulfurococcales archaeon]|jgi:Kef-type K+ transport system membrane component KefB|nr:cation:proton antiporter [Desulfurococcales archaeon]